MTSTDMLARTRTLLEESTAAFWTDAEIYAALADGQNAVINVLLGVYKGKSQINNQTELPYELTTLLENAAAAMASSSLNIPTGFLWLVSAQWSYNGTVTAKPCIIVNDDRTFVFLEDNTYLGATASNPKAYIAPVSSVMKINFLPAYATSGTYGIRYLKTPTAIASGQNPTLPVSTHSAIVFYATAQMLYKDEKFQEAQMMLNDYSKELQNLIR